jgi:hypothetical protein
VTQPLASENTLSCPHFIRIVLFCARQRIPEREIQAELRGTRVAQEQAVGACLNFKRVEERLI